MEAEKVIQGRCITPDGVVLIRDLLADNPSWNRSRLSRELCERWGWRNEKGRLKDMACRTLLLKLERRGEIGLPPREAGRPNERGYGPLAEIGHDQSPIAGDLGVLRPLRIEPLRSGDRRLASFKFLLHRYHYLGHRTCVGENLKIVVGDNSGRLLACMLFGSAAWKAKGRDVFIGWEPRARERNLSLLTNNTRLIALDGTWYFSSDKIHCENCSGIEHKSGQTLYHHSAITPVIVAPGQPYAIPPRPEFIIPRDGSTKQDCEINAGKRWLDHNGAFYNTGLPVRGTQTGNDTLLDDDLYAHQPFCRRTLRNNYHFIFVCKPDSHKYLYQWVELLEPGQDLHTLKLRVKNKGKWEHHTYRYANAVPLVEEQDALKVNWCEVTVTSKAKHLYKNAFMDFMMRGLKIGPYQVK